MASLILKLNSVFGLYGKWALNFVLCKGIFSSYMVSEYTVTLSLHFFSSDNNKTWDRGGNFSNYLPFCCWYPSIHQLRNSCQPYRYIAWPVGILLAWWLPISMIWGFPFRCKCSRHDLLFLVETLSFFEEWRIAVSSFSHVHLCQRACLKLSLHGLFWHSTHLVCMIFFVYMQLHDH